MNRPLTPLLRLALVAALALPSPALGTEDHELRAQQATVRLGLESLDGLSLESLLGQSFVRVPAGGVDLYMTAHALTAPWASGIVTGSDSSVRESPSSPSRFSRQTSPPGP